MRAIGLMSGTSLDGMDVAMLDCDGERVSGFGPALTMPFDAATKFALLKAVDDALNWRFEGEGPDSFAPAAALLAKCANDAVQAVLNKAGLRPEAIDVIGFHGQTVLHVPPVAGGIGKTCQIGDAQWLADTLGVPVVHDFRTRDMKEGGHGAPLVPAYHRALAADLPKPVMVLNIGGVGNLTWLGQDGEMLAFDTGPGNGPLDALIVSSGAGEMDRNGKIAAKGRVDEVCLEALLSAEFFSQPPPKSVDRWAFDTSAVLAMPLEDAAATLTAFCTRSVAQAMNWLPVRPKAILVCGGGRHNPYLMTALARDTGAHVASVESKGWRGDALEAEAFAFLAVRRMNNLPTSWPETTGVKVPVCGGAIAAPS